MQEEDFAGTSLDDMLGETQEEQQQTEQETTEQAEARARDDKGRFAAKTGVEDAVPPTDKLPPEEYAGLKDERRKRQEAEQRLQALEQELQSLRNPPAPPPSIFEDEQGWQQQFGSQVVTTAVQHASLNATLNTSEMLARRDHEDFEEAKAVFLDLAAQNPQLREQALADPHPWAKAYQIAKTHRTMQELGAVDIDSLREQIRQEELAKLQSPQRPGLPPTLTTERNLGTRSGPQWAGPTSLSDMLK